MIYTNNGILLSTPKQTILKSTAVKHYSKENVDYDSDYSDASISSGFTTDADIPNDHHKNLEPEISVLTAYKDKDFYKLPNDVVKVIDNLYKTLNSMSPKEYKFWYDRLQRELYIENAPKKSLSYKLFDNGNAPLFQRPKDFGTVNVYDFCPKTTELDKLHESSNKLCDKAIVHVRDNAKVNDLGLKATSSLYSEGIKEYRLSTSKDHTYINRSSDKYSTQQTDQYSSRRNSPRSRRKYKKKKSGSICLVIFIIIIIIVMGLFVYFSNANHHVFNGFKGNKDSMKYGAIGLIILLLLICLAFCPFQ